MQSSAKSEIGAGFLAVLAFIVVVFVLVAAGVGGCGLYKSWHRGQIRADAQNRVQITKIEIANQDQQAKVVAAQNGIVRAQAEQRYLEAVGIRRAQDEISRTLTPLYIQHEAIQAEEAIAKSGQNNTVVYVPSGNMGVPLVQSVPGLKK